MTEAGFGTRLGHSVAQVEYVKAGNILPRYPPGRNPNLARRGGIHMADKKSSSIKIGRDAGTGQFIPVKEAKERPKTAVVETIKKK